MDHAASPNAPRALWPSRSDAAVAYFPGEEADVLLTTRVLFLRRLSPWEFASLAGAPDNTCVEVGLCRDELYLETHEIRANCYSATHRVSRIGSELCLINDSIHLHRRELCSRGVGLRIFCRQLTQATALGIDAILTVGGRENGENGYYTWPRFGFDAPLPPAIRRRLPTSLARRERLLELMDCKAGRQWWRDHGAEVELTFDVREASPSRLALARYLRGNPNTRFRGYV